MQIWRICRARHRSTAFSGVGAELKGGRWNHKGRRMVYSSINLSLASLETFVHMDPADSPSDLISILAELPDDASVEELTIAELPRDWNASPAPEVLKDIGTAWLEELRSPALLVPSAVNAEEKNVLLNPLHPEFSKLQIVRSQAFHFDARMWK